MNAVTGLEAGWAEPSDAAATRARIAMRGYRAAKQVIGKKDSRDRGTDWMKRDGETG
jgi:hypothetical protein